MSKYNQPDPRNAGTWVHVGGELVKREDAKVSVLDSLVQGGDGVWEGLRVYDGKIFQLNEHIDRMLASAKAMHFRDIPSLEEIRQAVFDTLKANDMRDGVHIRLTLSRGMKSTSGMNPELNVFGACLIVLPEYKPPVYGTEGTSLITSSVRRNAPQCLDSKIHHNNLINNILAKIEANISGADDAVMLDINGFVAETNATNIFLLKGDVLTTPTTDSCVTGLTRAKVLELAQANGIRTEVRNITPSELYAADEVFTTGTMGGLSPVATIDGRKVGTGEPGPLLHQLRALYLQAVENEAESLPF